MIKSRFATKGVPMQLRFALMTAALATVFLGLAADASAAPQPAWSLQVSSFPTNFPPETVGGEEKGPAYLIVAENVGGADTVGEFKVVSQLPAGLSVSPSRPPEGKTFRADNGFQPMSCSVSSQTVTCKSESSVSSRPGELVQVTIYVSVAASAPATLVNETVIEGGGAAAVFKQTPTEISSEHAPFDFTPGSSGLDGSIVNADGSSATQASSHPENLEIAMNFNRFTLPTSFSAFASGNGVKDIVTHLPKGMVVNPQATPQCLEAQLETLEGCPADTQIGTVNLTLGLASAYNISEIPIYNMVPPAGVAAEFAFQVVAGVYVHLDGFVRSGGDYGLSAASNDILAKVFVGGVKVNFWGDPTASTHDNVRGECLSALSLPSLVCPPAERLNTALLTMPSQCTGPIVTSVTADSWQDPNIPVTRSVTSHDLNGNPVGVDGCNKVEFNPTIKAQPTTNVADSPTGLDFGLHIAQNQEPQALAPANLKDSRVVLPEGLVINPSASDGLGSCTPAEIELNGPNPASCPEAAKVGTVEIRTPMLENPLPGAVYVAEPFDNPFDSLLALYIAVGDPRTGVVIKLAGKVEPDPHTGRLTAVFTENPELPFEDLNLSFFNGARAPLKTSPVCGTYQTTTRLTPWSSPEGADATPSDSFATSVAPGGGSCATSAASLPHQTAFTAGTVAPTAGAYSPFVLRLTRPDGSQRITGLDTTLPPGLTGKLAGIPYCSEGQIAVAESRAKPDQGKLEQQSPSCPGASEVGTVDVGAGAGPTPLHVPGRIYLSGPYKGAPLSLTVITPAVAGPFDLGNVVTRAALFVDPLTAQIHAVSDPLPTIIEGIPLDIRSVVLKMGRPSFTLNPTSCDPMAVNGAASMLAGPSAGLSSPFQVGGCTSLAFKPRLKLRLKGGTKRNQYPALTATVNYTGGQANIERAAVTFPHSEFLAQNHIRTVCTRVQFNAGPVPGAACPAGSVYGQAKAVTPLLDKPLEGPVFLRSSSHKLPDVVVALRGQVNVVLVGRVDSVKGQLRNTFESVPDAPISSFTLQMQGGRKGLLVNSTNICKSTNRATVRMDGQNGKTYDTRPVIKNSCRHKAKKNGGKRKHGSKRKHGRG